MHIPRPDTAERVSIASIFGGLWTPREGKNSVTRRSATRPPALCEVFPRFRHGREPGAVVYRFDACFIAVLGKARLERMAMSGAWRGRTSFETEV